jgi:fatty acid desaturase
MATDPSDFRRRLQRPAEEEAEDRPVAEPPRQPPRRADYPTEGRPVLRAVIWTTAILCGGLLVVLLFFTMIGAVDFSDAPWLGVLAIAMAVFFIGTLAAYARSERAGNTRWADRERRGF